MVMLSKINLLNTCKYGLMNSICSCWIESAKKCNFQTSLFFCLSGVYYVINRIVLSFLGECLLAIRWSFSSQCERSKLRHAPLSIFFRNTDPFGYTNSVVTWCFVRTLTFSENCTNLVLLCENCPDQVSRQCPWESSLGSQMPLSDKILLAWILAQWFHRANGARSLETSLCSPLRCIHAWC